MDGWLLQRFPGKTLEELDDMDWGRFVRANQALEIERIEKLHTEYLKGKKKTADLTEAEWRMIRNHNELVNADTE